MAQSRDTSSVPELEIDEKQPSGWDLKLWDPESHRDGEFCTAEYIEDFRDMLVVTDRPLRQTETRRALLRALIPDPSRPGGIRCLWTWRRPSEIAAMYKPTDPHGTILPAHGVGVAWAEKPNEEKDIPLTMTVVSGDEKSDEDEVSVEQRLELVRTNIETMLIEFWNTCYPEQMLDSHQVLWLRGSSGGKQRMRFVVTGYRFKSMLYAREFAEKLVEHVYAEDESLISTLDYWSLIIPQCIPLVGSALSDSNIAPEMLMPISIIRGFKPIDALLSVPVPDSDPSLIEDDHEAEPRPRREWPTPLKQLSATQRSVITSIAQRCHLDPSLIRWSGVSERRSQVWLPCPRRVVVPLEGRMCLLKQEQHDTPCGYLEIEYMTASYRCMQCPRPVQKQKAKHATIVTMAEFKSFFEFIELDERQLVTQAMLKANELQIDKEQLLECRDEEMCGTLEHKHDGSSTTGIKSGMGTLKTQEIGSKALDHYKQYTKRRLRGVCKSARFARWQQIDALLGNREKAIVEMGIPSIISILPRIVCVQNVHMRMNKIIKDAITATVTGEELGFAIDGSSDAERKEQKDLQCRLIVRLYKLLRFTQYKQIDHKDLKSKQRRTLAFRVITCLDSAWKFSDLTYDIFFFDESESNISALTSDKLKRSGNTMRCALALQKFFADANATDRKRAGGVFLLDADLSAKSMRLALSLGGGIRRVNFVVKTRPSQLTKRTYHLYVSGQNEESARADQKRGLKPLTSRQAWFMELKRCVLLGERLFIVTNSRDDGYTIKNFINRALEAENERRGQEGLAKLGTRVGYWNANSDDSKKQRLTDMNAELKQYDIVIFSPVVTVGSDFSEVHYFKRVFCYCVGQSGDIEQQIQSVCRVRLPEVAEVHLFLKNRCSFVGLPITRDEVTRSVNERSELLKELKLTTPTQIPNWLRDCFIDEVLQRNLSLTDYGECLLKQLVRTGCPWDYPERPVLPRDEAMLFAKFINDSKSHVEEDIYNDDKTFPFTGETAQALLVRSKSGHNDLKEQEKIHLEKIRFLQANGKKKKPTYEHYRSKKQPELRSTLGLLGIQCADEEAMLAADPECLDEVGECSDPVKYAAMDSLLQKFQLTAKDARPGSDSKKTLDSEWFEADRKNMSKLICQVAATFNIKAPKAAELQWKSHGDKDHSAELLLNKTLKKFNFCQLAAICQKDDCSSPLNCSNAEHRPRKRIQAGESERLRRPRLYSYTFQIADDVPAAKRQRIEEELAIVFS